MTDAPACYNCTHFQATKRYKTVRGIKTRLPSVAGTCGVDGEGVLVGSRCERHEPKKVEAFHG